jgi:hypothetical protein
MHPTHAPSWSPDTAHGEEKSDPLDAPLAERMLNVITNIRGEGVMWSGLSGLPEKDAKKPGTTDRSGAE